MEGLTIEKMRVEDLPQVLVIENVSFPTPFTENLFRMEMNLNVAHLYVARMGDIIVGYIDYWRVGVETHLITIAVHPEWKRKKVASVLIDGMLDDCRKHSVERVTLDVRPSNEAAISLYRKYGFYEAGRRKEYYQDNGEDALVLNLDLK